MLFFLSIQLYKEIEICQKITQHIQIEKSDASSDIYGGFLLDLFFCFCQVYSSVSRFLLALRWYTWKACWTHWGKHIWFLCHPQKARSPALEQDSFICSALNAVFPGARDVGCAAIWWELWWQKGRMFSCSCSSSKHHLQRLCNWVPVKNSVLHCLSHLTWIPALLHSGRPCSGAWERAASVPCLC